MAALTYKRFSVDNTTWTPIPAPVDCNNAVLMNLGADTVKLRTASGDPNTEKPLAVNGQEVVLSPTRQDYQTRFRSGDVIVYIQAGSSTATILGSFIA